MDVSRRAIAGITPVPGLCAAFMELPDVFVTVTDEPVPDI